jgi:hypothetical protein
MAHVEQGADRAAVQDPVQVGELVTDPHETVICPAWSSRICIWRKLA